MTARSSQFRIKILFLAFILWQPLQYAFRAKFGEAYPMLQLPDFHGTLTDCAGNIELGDVDAEVLFAD